MQGKEVLLKKINEGIQGLSEEDCHFLLAAIADTVLQDYRVVEASKVIQMIFSEMETYLKLDIIS